MKAITVEAPGGPEQLRFSDVETPDPGPGEVRVRVTAAGVNRADLLQRQGYYPPPAGISQILGLEVAGVVDAVGSDQPSGSPVVGDQVVALLAGGGYAQYAVAPAGQCAPVPTTMNLKQAAGIMETAATVVSNFDHIGVRPGETILIHGGTGGIGSFAIPYAKHLWLRVITTVGSAEKAELARDAGAEVALDYHQDWEQGVRSATDGAGVDAILDIIGAKYLEANVRCLARGGRMTVIGLQGGTKATLDIGRLLSKAATITATSLRFRPLAEKAAIVRQVQARVWPLFESGAIPLAPLTTFRLDQAAEAHDLLASGRSFGKIVLTVD
ncbi:MAG: NAD(P)H-quinone oxidoreductase [Propionibacteriaceae bacterium]|jgi:putative PIG3 family NAD(P)H quinone oxidoreductase|nr:NAD(P)H-quinone oxidoreductase [Propionibacteriaceae bacterium]